MLGGIIGGVAHFFLGWLVWGILLMKFMMNHINPSASVVFRTEADMVWWSLIVGNIAMGFLICYILMKAGVRSVAGGASTGAVVGFLASLGMNCIMYAQMKVYGNTAMAADIAAATVVTAIIGAILGWFLGRNNAS